MKPDISVVIPVYNNAHYMADAINSALSQTGVEHEVLVVDDSSEDETPEIIKDFMKADNRITYVRALSNAGVAGARNAGVEAASGQWIAFLDADDRWHADKLFRQIELIKQYEACGKYPPICYTGAYVMNGDGSYAGRVIKALSRISCHELLMGNVIVASAAMVRRECLLEYPFKRGNLHEDYIEWYRILANYGAGVGVSLPLVRYRLTNRTKSRNKLETAYMAWRTYKYLGLSTPQTMVSFAFYLRYGLQRYVL